MPMALMINSEITQRNVRFFARDCKFVASPLPVAAPNLTAMSCKTIVAITEKTSAQISDAPYVAPATLAVVIVPGPIKAAAIKYPDFFEAMVILIL